jgi:hypothetical protein
MRTNRACPNLQNVAVPGLTRIPARIRAPWRHRNGFEGEIDQREARLGAEERRAVSSSGATDGAAIPQHPERSENAGLHASGV